MVEDLKKQIAKLYEEIEAIQNECSHPKMAVTKTYRGSSGNYDRTCDGYWIDFHCKLCDKRWTESQ